jgi:2-methylcitrate dehydratase PrpD
MNDSSLVPALDKPYPICSWGHASIDAARELMLAHGPRLEEITEVRIRSFDYAVQLFSAMPDTTSKAQYSLPFAVATMIVYGRIDARARVEA